MGEQAPTPRRPLPGRGARGAGGARGPRPGRPAGGSVCAPPPPARPERTRPRARCPPRPRARAVPVPPREPGRAGRGHEGWGGAVSLLGCPLRHQFPGGAPAAEPPSPRAAPNSRRGPPGPQPAGCWARGEPGHCLPRLRVWDEVARAASGAGRAVPSCRDRSGDARAPPAGSPAAGRPCPGPSGTLVETQPGAGVRGPGGRLGEGRGGQGGPAPAPLLFVISWGGSGSRLQVYISDPARIPEPGFP